MPEKNIVTVSELTQQIKYTLETKYPSVWVEGEISNFKLHTSGHMYFTLKDERAQIAAVFWRSRNTILPFKLFDGMKVIVHGALTVYPPHGNYQITVEQVHPLGVGELQLLFEQLKRKLAAEGLFDPRRKKQIPRYPQRIGIITSETGAALYDMLNIIARRNPSVEVFFYPVRVQGVGAAEEIAQAIRDCNTFGDLDVLIIGRGGGSLEDLWAFNEEIVARAIAASTIPTISAVGHEIDVSIADFVADLRAPTPSAAAELVTRERDEIIAEIHSSISIMRRYIEMRFQDVRNKLSMNIWSYEFNRPPDIIREFIQRCDELVQKLEIGMVHFLEEKDLVLDFYKSQFNALNPHDVLRRGYAIVRKDGKVVSSKLFLKPGDAAEIQFHDGRVNTRIERN